MRRIGLLFGVWMLSVSAAFASDGPAGVKIPLKELDRAVLPLLGGSADTGTIANTLIAREIIERTLKVDWPSAKLDDPGFYCLMHVVRWTDPSKTTEGQTVQSSRWYVYNPSPEWDWAKFTGKRLYGVPRIWVLTIQLNLSTKISLTSASPVYTVDFKPKTPLNVEHLKALVELFPTSTIVAVDSAPTTRHAYGAQPFESTQRTSDISISATMPVPGPNVPNKKEQDASLGEPVTFDNEGKARWDASVGIPIRGSKDLNVDSKAGTAAPKTVTKSTAFGLISIFLRPVDLKQAGPRFTPAIVAGYGINTRDLLVGLGWGAYLADFYVGAVFVNQKNENGDGTWTWKNKPVLRVGVSIGVKSFVGKLKK